MKALSLASSGPAPTWDLAQVVDALAAANADLLRGGQRKLGRQKLPSPEALAEIIADLRAVLFPAHFGAGHLSDDGIRNYVGHRLDAALFKLQEQVRRWRRRESLFGRQHALPCTWGCLCRPPLSATE